MIHLKKYRYFLLGFLLCMTAVLKAEIKPGLDKNEALDMIAICNSFTFLELYNADTSIIPKGYQKVYTSGVFGMDNKFQVYEKGHQAVINIRGSTDKQISWLENIYSAMIPAIGEIETQGQTFKYTFSNQTNAAIHSGFALGLAYLHTDLISRIQLLNSRGIFDIYITGHSQGGALANLFMAYLKYLPNDIISEKNNFKLYAFGAPMFGNKEFMEDYNASFGENSVAFNFINPEDPIPDLPISYNDSNFIKDNIKAFLFDRESFSLKEVVTDGSVILFEGKIAKYMKRFGNSTSNRISKDLGYVKMPKYVDDFNYQKPKNIILLTKFEYPKILKDSSILGNDSLMALYKRDEKGQFENKRLYKKEPWAYQHKSYNYFASIYALYFPKSFALMDRKFLVENL